VPAADEAAAFLLFLRCGVRGSMPVMKTDLRYFAARLCALSHEVHDWPALLRAGLHKNPLVGLVFARHMYVQVKPCPGGGSKPGTTVT